MFDDLFPDEIFEDNTAPVPEDVSAFAAAEDDDPHNHMSDQEVN
ncbi:hypothetical protein ACOBQX_18040 [Actinokineospora sp. G85]